MKVFILFSQKEGYDPLIVNIHSNKKSAYEDLYHFREIDVYRLFYVEEWDVIE